LEPPPYLLSILQPLTIHLSILLLLVLLLVIISALLSGSEVAMFSLSIKDKEKLSDEKENKRSQKVLLLLESPKKLLATILIANNLVNVSIVMTSTFVMNHLFYLENMSELTGFIVQVILVTFIILLFGEVIPKVYANNYSVAFSKFMSFPIYTFKLLFSPFSNVLINSTSIIDKRFEKNLINLTPKNLNML
jgi:Mg2+/Co2+ transporter CorB